MEIMAVPECKDAVFFSDWGFSLIMSIFGKKRQLVRESANSPAIECRALFILFHECKKIDKF
jgi:hypothetical protein